MSDDDRTSRLDPWDRPTRRLSSQEAEPTRRILPEDDPEPTRRYSSVGEYEAPGTITLDDEAYGPPAHSRSQPRHDVGEEEDNGLPRWALPLVTGVIGLIAGIVLVLLLSGAGNNDVVPRQTLVEQQAQAAAALQDAQAQISARDARIAELEQQVAQLSESQGQAAGAQQQALDARERALDEREAALDAREQSLNQREEAQDGDGTLPDIPGVDLPDVNLPDVNIPEQEARNLLERFLDLLRGGSEQPA
jgi:uncharacterized membrane-anchored protein YhcB (DUF1043 family)